MKTYINLPVRADTHQKVMLFKIRAKVKNIDTVIKMAMKALKEQQK